MKQSMFVYVVSAAVAAGAGALCAQEMGVAAAPATAVAAPAAAVPAESASAAAEAVAAVAASSKKDDGPQIVEAAQQQPPAEVVPSGAGDAMVNWVAEHGYAEGFNDERGYILQIGVARDNALDPLDEDFMTKREMLYREAQLRAKCEIAGIVNREVSGRNWKEGLAADDIKAFEAKYAREINEMNEMKRKVANLMVALDTAETAQLKGVTTTDRLNRLVDSIIKKLDSSYNAGQIAAEKQARYEAIKKQYELAKAAADELEQKKIDLFPSAVVHAAIDSAVRIQLQGTMTLHQMESYVGHEFQVAVAVIWSPKLEDRAAKILARQEVAVAKPTENRTLNEYLRANAASLPSMVGSRQFVDKNGRLYFIGIAAQGVPKDAVEKDENITFANQMAMQAVVMSLFVEGKGFTQAQAALAKRKGRSGDTMKALVENMDESTPKNTSVSGLGKVYSIETVYPVTQKPIYISVAAVDAAMAAKAPAIQRAWDLKAEETVRTLNTIAAERQAAEQSYQNAKNQVNPPAAPAVQGGVQVIAPAAAPQPAGRVQQGIFGGKATHSDDF